MTSLLDVNVLVALLWEDHLHHAAARRWFAARAGRWSTCAITQTGFVRVSANPIVLEHPVAVAEAVAVLREAIVHRDHLFLPDPTGFVDNPLVPHDRLIGHRQVTDAHLVAIARQHSVSVVTFDQTMTDLAPDVVRVVHSS